MRGKPKKRKKNGPKKNLWEDPYWPRLQQAANTRLAVANVLMLWNVCAGSV